MNLLYPLKNPRIFQNFAQVWIADRDMVLSGIEIKKGDNVYKKAFGMEGHNGLDFFAETGTPVYAVHDGFIFCTTGKPGYGNDIRHSWAEDGYNWDAIYGHLNSFVGTDRQVKQGELIAYTDNTGFSSGPHLHFGLRPNLGNSVVNYNNGYLGYVDPLPFMKGNMTNAKLIKVGNEVGYWFPAVTGDGLKSQAANVGETLPLKTDGTIDWDKVTFDHQI